MSDRARYWQRLVAAWEKSGLSQAEFCRRRKVKAVNFGWWKRKLELISKSHPGTSRSGSNRKGPSPKSAKPRFVEFRMTDAATAPAYEVVTPVKGCFSHSLLLGGVMCYDAEAPLTRQLRRPLDSRRTLRVQERQSHAMCQGRARRPAESRHRTSFWCPGQAGCRRISPRLSDQRYT